MKHIIEGILVKYNEPMYSRWTVIKPGAFDKHKVQAIPIYEDLDFGKQLVGWADLRYEEDGVYYTGRLLDRDNKSDEIIQE